MKVSFHDHVGHMTYTDESMWCNECGQQWRIVEFSPGRRTLIAMPYEGSHPAGVRRGLRTLSAPPVPTVNEEPL